MKRVLIIGAQPVASLGLSIVVKGCVSDCLIHRANTFKEAERSANNDLYDLIIMDIDPKDGELKHKVEHLRHSRRQNRILVSSDTNDSFLAVQMFTHGVSGFICKAASELEYAYAILTVLTDRKYVSDSMQNVLISEFIFSRYNRVPRGLTKVHYKQRLLDVLMACRLSIKTTASGYPWTMDIFNELPICDN
jgi:DNA-binding NarL/FixJ family response regulator